MPVPNAYFNSTLFQLKISLVDFAWRTSVEQLDSTNDCQFIYGQVSDLASNHNIQLCGGGERKVLIMESASHSVQLVMSDNIKESKNRFLIQFEGKYI